MLAEGKSASFVSDKGGAFGCLWLSFTDHRDPASRVPPRRAGGGYHYCWLLDPAKRNSSAGLNMFRYTPSHAGSRGVIR